MLVSHFDMKRAMTVAARGGGSPATMFARLLVFDARTLALVGERPLCVAPHGMATTPDDRTLVVACHGSDELAVVDLSQPSLPTSRDPLGIAQGVPGVPHYGPYSVALPPAGDRVLVANLESKDLLVFDLARRAFVAGAGVPLGARAYMPAFAGESAALVPLQAPDGLARVDLAARRITIRVSYTPRECGRPHAARVARDGRAYVVCEGDHEGPGAVLEIDPVTLATRRRWPVGVYPDGIAFGDGS